MFRRFRPATVAGIILVPVLAAGFVVQERSTQDGARLFDQVLNLVGTRFVDTLDAAALYERAARGLVEELNDPYSELLSPKQLSAFDRTTGGKYGGVGMQIEDQQGNITVSRVFPNTPAERAGIIEGDRIVRVDTTATRGFKIGQVSDLLLGTPGTKVSATFLRPGVAEPIVVNFTRSVVLIPAVPYSLTFGDVGYIPLQQFNESADTELEAAIRALEAKGATKLVLDLRGNPGGYLEKSLEISNMFLAQGQELASVRGRGGDSQVYVAREKPIAPRMPVVVLINGYSASASEIVAGSLQDHDRALVLGTTSYGKGLVQTVFKLDGGYALKMTTAKWFTPAGRSIQKERKLMPDGSYVETHPDSLETDSARRARPTFKSDAGRTVYGGGAIAPDLVVKPDTFTTVEQQFIKAYAPKAQEVYVWLYEFALRQRGKIKPDFQVQQAWRDSLFARVTAAGVKTDRAQFDASRRFVDGLLEDRIARLAFGDSAARRRDVRDDVQLRTAVELLQRVRTQQDLFEAARVASAARTPAQPAGTTGRP